LHDEFAEFQIGRWRERCRALRQAVDRVQPEFQFCIYPAPGTPFMMQAAFPEWTTDRAPLIFADASTYGRSSRFLPEREALERNRDKLLARKQAPQQTELPFIYTGGIDPVVTGADPEFSGKNAVIISQATDGYWIFYEGPTYTKQDHADYWKWFTWANKAIIAGKLQAWRQPRESPENWSLDVFANLRQQPQTTAAQTTDRSIEFPAVKLRRENVIVVACQAGRPVRVVLKNEPVARYQSLLLWELRDAALAKTASGTIPHGESGEIVFTPKSSGIYLLGASAGSCAYRVVSSNAPVGLYAAESLKLIQGAKRLYFHVPGKLSRFELSVAGAGDETAKLNVYDPRGRLAASGQTSRPNPSVKLEVQTADQSGATWSIEITRADQGVLEDSTIRLDPKLPPVLSLTPENVFQSNAKN
jgi:hypothetical protein